MIEPTVPSLSADRVVLTGRRRAGKDFIAEKNGYTIYGFADPMYELAEHFVGSSDKEKPGVLEFILKVGAWGRGEVSEEYPLTPERRRITEDIRENATDYTSIGSTAGWKSFGELENFWIRLMGKRIRHSSEKRIAVTNARFPSELRVLLDEGFEHRHVMCSEDTRKGRLGDEKYDGSSENPMDLPKTEHLAANLDQIAEQSPDLINYHFRQSPVGDVPGWDPAMDLTMEGQGGEEIDLIDEIPPRVAEDLAKGRTLVWNDPDAEPGFSSETDSPSVKIDWESGHIDASSTRTNTLSDL